MLTKILKKAGAWCLINILFLNQSLNGFRRNKRVQKHFEIFSRHFSISLAQDVFFIKTIKNRCFVPS
jgi:hypothetical protein